MMNSQGVEKTGHMTESKKTIKEGLTPRQLEIYKEIVDFISGNKYSPSYEEIKQLANLRSKSEVHRYVHQLSRRGWIRLGHGRNRSISIVGGHL
jgi:repressor LexA